MIQVYWDNPEKTIIRLDYSNPVENWDEYDLAVDQSYELARSVSHQVIIIHHAGRTRMPAGNSFLHIRRANSHIPPNVEQLIPVISNKFASDAVNFSLRVLGTRKLYMTTTLEDAYQQARRLLSSF